MTSRNLTQDHSRPTRNTRKTRTRTRTMNTNKRINSTREGPTVVLVEVSLLVGLTVSVRENDNKSSVGNGDHALSSGNLVFYF